MSPEVPRGRPGKKTAPTDPTESSVTLSADRAPATLDGEALLSKPDSLQGRMQRHVLRVLLDHDAAGELPTNGRFVFYELEGQGIVRKSREGEGRRGGQYDPREKVIDALSYLRKKGVVPWEWVEDETRTLTEWKHAPTVAEFVQDAVRRARINPWDGAPPLLLLESRSLAGVLGRVAGRYLVSIAPTNGQVGGFLHAEVAPVLEDNDRPVLYLGDWDHQGHQIENNTRCVLEREAGRSIDWTRIAITKEQIEERGLEPVWKKDGRYKPALEQEAWEAEALGQGTIQNLVREELDRLLPEPIEAVLEREKAQRARVAAALADLVGGTR